MSFVIAAPAAVGAAASHLADIGSTISAANILASMPTTTVVAAAGDQVSAAVAALFSGHAQGYQALGAQAATFHQEFVEALTSGASAYAAADTASASPMQQLLNTDAAPMEAPTAGNSTNGAAGTATDAHSVTPPGDGAVGGSRATGLNGGTAGLLKNASAGGAGGSAATGNPGAGGWLLGNGGAGVLLSIGRAGGAAAGTEADRNGGARGAGGLLAELLAGLASAGGSNDGDPGFGGDAGVRFGEGGSDDGGGVGGFTLGGASGAGLVSDRETGGAGGSSAAGADASLLRNGGIGGYAIPGTGGIRRTSGRADSLLGTGGTGGYSVLFGNAANGGLLLDTDGFNARLVTSPLHNLQQQALGVITAPTQAVLRLPLIGSNFYGVLAGWGGSWGAPVQAGCVGDDAGLMCVGAVDGSA
jgi:hypothetical protein